VQKNIERLLKSKSCPGCYLVGADLSQKKLEKANLEGANLSGANLSLADLSQANLRKANLRNARLDRADLTYTDLEGAHLSGTVLEGALFSGTKMKGQVVNRLLHADQAQGTSSVPQTAAAQSEQTENPAKVSPASVTRVPAGASSVGQETGHPVETADHSRSGQPSEGMLRAAGVEPSSSSQEKDPVPALEPLSSPVESMPKGAAATTTKVEERSAEEINTGRQELINQMFEQERCVGCDLSGLDLSGRDMGGFDLERADFHGTNLREADLSGANLKGANLQNAQVQGADLSEADLYRADFTGADLSGADLEDAAVDGADLSGATGLERPNEESVP
jgi:uncharacterized protein YjbI with pentapeptide repeats